MAEANENTDGLTTEDAQAFLDEFGFENLAKAKEVFAKYKGDVKDLKGKSKTFEDVTTELNALKAEAEKNRVVELSEAERLKEVLGEKDSSLVSLQAQIEEMKKARIFDGVMYDHMKDLSMSKTRSKLYQMAVKATDWATADELQGILADVDKDFDSEIESVGIKLPLPGDGDNTSRTSGSTKYDAEFFKNFHKNK